MPDQYRNFIERNQSPKSIVTADFKASKEADELLKDITDENIASVEKHNMELEEEIELMKQDDLLDPEDLENLEKVNQALDDIKSYIRAVTSARICLLRG